MRNISQKALGEVKIPIPPPSVQQEVAATLAGELDAVRKLDMSVGVASVRSGHLRYALLREAFAGRLVPQDSNDEPALVLLERIRAERDAAPKRRRGRRSKVTAAQGNGRRIDPDRPMPAPVPNGTQSELELGL
ncbi:hypothetical protein GTS_46730 [Gandjariella thermophila]|uniref:Type I restriction modification DNA specificity domain-containing protein n=2 Tax=Gandjariella thermophila TaxID=1931992 RepID=A0A4D4JDE7_9PSEU|nr:hypothetical protein GTS_46730 [Gandjariella thermophila]